MVGSSGRGIKRTVGEHFTYESGIGVGYRYIFAKQAGYDKCYIETLPFMKDAQKLYVKSGFTYIDAPMGSTGHNACDVFMIKDL